MAKIEGMQLVPSGIIPGNGDDADLGRGTSTTFVPAYRCLGEQILVKRIDLEDDVTPGGVVKPQIARVKSNRGIVMAIGEGRMIGNTFVPFNLEVGDTVLFSRHGGTDVELDGLTYILLHWKMIYMVENAAH